MARVNINNGDSGLIVRTNLNNMFIELYANIGQVTKIPNTTGAFAVLVALNTWIDSITIFPVTGTLVGQIGLTPGGSEILPATTISAMTRVQVQDWFQSAGDLYFSFTGIGTVNVRMDSIPNFN